MMFCTGMLITKFENTITEKRYCVAFFNVDSYLSAPALYKPQYAEFMFLFPF